MTGASARMDGLLGAAATGSRVGSAKEQRPDHPATGDNHPGSLGMAASGMSTASPPW